MKTATLQGQFSLRCLDQRHEDAMILDKKKMLIGSHEHCDFRLRDKSVSTYHAFLCLQGDEGFMVKDLYSEGGIFVNGKRVDESFVNPGDVLTIGTLSFAIEVLDDAVPVFNPDAEISAKIPVESVELPAREGLTFIDGEYCDIKFDESNYVPLKEMLRPDFHGDFVDLDYTVEPLEIVHQVKDKRLEVISYMNGLMMDISYISFKNGDYFTDPLKESRNVIRFHSLNRTKLFTIKNGNLRFYPNETLLPSTPWDKVNLNEPLFLTHGAEQISIRLVGQSVDWRGIPLFYRDRAFFKQGSKVFAAMFMPLLILLFINTERPAEVKQEIAVVYKLPTKVEKAIEAKEKSEVKAEELTSKTENTGHKENNQPVKEKVEFAQASKQEKVVAKNTAPAPAQAQPVQTTPVKAYEFKSSVSMGSLVADAPKINTEGSGKSATKDATFNTGSADDGQLVAGADIGVSSFNGSDKKGSGAVSYGSRGLAAKSGFDTSYIEPKTVVLGSMDPELLRKILREYIPQFRHCYQQELIGHSEKVKGVIDLNFTISATGKVSKYNIKVKDAQFSQKGVGCMGQVLGLIDFPKPKGGGVVDVRQPLNFFAETEKI